MMDRRALAGFLSAAVAAGLAVVALPTRPAAAADPPLFDFESDAQGWASPQVGSQVSITHAAADVKVGQGALEWSYDPTADEPLVGRQAPELKAGATTMEFWIRCSADANFQVFLGEGAARYIMAFRTIPDHWYHCRANLGDLSVGSDKDPSGQLELDAVRYIILQDFSRYSSEPGELRPRKVWLDGLTFSKEDAPQRRYTKSEAGKLEVFLDDFEADALPWESTTSSRVSVEKVDTRSVLRWRYQQGKAAVSIGDHVDSRYGQAKAIKLVGRATRATRLAIEMREWDGDYEGPSYQAFVDIPAGTEWHTLSVPLSEFKVTPRKADGSGKLDMDLVWLFNITEATKVDAPTENVLELDSISAVL
jgi:hypothetical protein